MGERSPLLENSILSEWFQSFLFMGTKPESEIEGAM
jgi:hypothetical protein